MGSTHIRHKWNCNRNNCVSATTQKIYFSLSETLTSTQGHLKRAEWRSGERIPKKQVNLSDSQGQITPDLFFSILSERNPIPLFPAKSCHPSGLGAFISAGHVQTCPTMVFCCDSRRGFLSAIFEISVQVHSSQILCRCWKLLHIYKIWSWWITHE